MFPVYRGSDDVVARKRAELYAAEKAKLLGRPNGRPNAPPQAVAVPHWFDDPIVIGTLLLMVPPVGLAAVWTSKRYSNDARWALTVMTALMMCLGAAVAVMFLARR